MYKKRIKARDEFRAEIVKKQESRIHTNGEETLLLISESLDDYLAQKIEADEVLEGILKDIQGNIASMAELNRSVLAEDTN